MVFKTGFLVRVAALFIVAILPACRTEVASTTVRPTAIPAQPSATPASATATPIPPSAPAQYLEFSSLDELAKAASFPLWLPTPAPAGLLFTKAWITNYTTGDQNVRLLYSAAGNTPDAALKSLDLQMTLTGAALSKDSIVNQSKAAAMDVQEVALRGQTGFTYWVPSGAAGNIACLAWREGGINFLISLYGDWPQPGEDNPHGLDATLLQVAGSLQEAK